MAFFVGRPCGLAISVSGTVNAGYSEYQSCMVTVSPSTPITMYARPSLLRTQSSPGFKGIKGMGSFFGLSSFNSKIWDGTSLTVNDGVLVFSGSSCKAIN